MFRKKTNTLAPVVLQDISDEVKQKQAIEYITGLDKKEFERFIESIKLIWQGYDLLYRVKTRDEKQAIKEEKEDDVFNSEIGTYETLEKDKENKGKTK